MKALLQREIIAAKAQKQAERLRQANLARKKEREEQAGKYLADRCTSLELSNAQLRVYIRRLEDEIERLKN